MKKTILILLSVVLLFSSCAEKRLMYKISGVAEGMENGEKVYMEYKKNGTKEYLKCDSAEIQKGKFAFEKVLTSIGEFDLTTPYGKRTIILSDNPLQVTIKVTEKEGRKGVLKTAEFAFNGDSEQELYAAFMRGQTVGALGMMGIAFMYPKAKEEGNVPLQDSLLANYQNSITAKEFIIDSLVTNFPDSYMAAFIVRDTYSKTKPYEIALSSYESLSERVKKSIIGVETKAILDEVGKTAVGQMAPDFKAAMPNGDEFSLSQLKGKYVLIDFWASWCGPCIAEVPNVKAVYDQYKSKDFEILSVSLDDNKEKWVTSIEKNELNWNHISTLKGWNCEIAKLYNVIGVPNMILLDKEGRIVTKDLRGEKLLEEVSKLIDNQ